MVSGSRTKNNVFFIFFLRQVLNNDKCKIMLTVTHTLLGGFPPPRTNKYS